MSAAAAILLMEYQRRDRFRSALSVLLAQEPAHFALGVFRRRYPGMSQEDLLHNAYEAAEGYVRDSGSAQIPSRMEWTEFLESYRCTTSVEREAACREAFKAPAWFWWTIVAIVLLCSLGFAAGFYGR